MWTISIYFHEEILVNILSRLPVRSLLQFKCVSKFWRTLISDPYFNIKHLNHAKNDPNSQKLLISQWFPKDGVISIYCCPLSSDQPVDDVQKLDCPSISKPWRCVICCSCDGLAIIDISDGVSYILLLWNPSTRESIVLPNSEFPRGALRCFGLGYDSTSGDYKILQICDNTNDPKLPSEILELKSGSWRKIDKHPRGFSNVLSDTQSLPFVCEAFHWIGMSNNYSVVSFSISSEVYGEIPLPEQILCMANICIGVSALEGMLCVHYTFYCPRMDTFKLWVMKDYGVKESWNALFIIEDSWTFKATPKYMFADGEVLFWSIDCQRGGNLFRTSKGPFGLWPCGDAVQNGIAFTESLISPKSLV